MKIETIFDSKMGKLNIIPFELLNKIVKEDIELITGTIISGDKTDLDGFFSADVIYLGKYEDELQFKIGESQDLFEHNIWTNSFFMIDEETIGTVYQAGTARDFRWKRGAWR